MSDMTIMEAKELQELQGQIAFYQNQFEMALKEIERLNERIREYEKNDKAKQGSE